MTEMTFEDALAKSATLQMNCWDAIVSRDPVKMREAFRAHIDFNPYMCMPGVRAPLANTRAQSY